MLHNFVKTMLRFYKNFVCENVCDNNYIVRCPRQYEKGAINCFRGYSVNVNDISSHKKLTDGVVVGEATLPTTDEVKLFSDKIR